MPLKLIPPKEGRTPYYRVRGTHRGVPVDLSTGHSDKRKAMVRLRCLESDIERGPPPAPKPGYCPTCGQPIGEAAQDRS